jgi:hypothetical protein
MLGDISPLDYMLATRLGKSLTEIRSLPNSEIVEWGAYLRYEHEMQKLYAKSRR